MKVKALKKFERICDSSVNRVRKDGEIFEVDKDRAELLLSKGLVEVLEKEKPMKKEEAEPQVENAMAEEPKEVKKAVRKSTKKVVEE